MLSGANEVAVEAFLARRLGFTQISKVVAAALDSHRVEPLDSIQAALRADVWARDFARNWIQTHGRESRPS